MVNDKLQPILPPADNSSTRQVEMRGKFMKAKKSRFVATPTARRRHLFESLEVRQVLSADIGLFSQLSIDSGSYAADSIIVRLAEDAQASSSLPALAGAQMRAPLANLPMFRTVDLAPGVSVEDAIALYAADPLVAYAEPDYRIQLTLEPDDVEFDELWGLNNTGQTGGVPDVDIDAPEAWEVTQGNGSTIVAVIDTGVDYRHPDLASNMWANVAEQNGSPGVDDDGNGYVDDVHGYDFYNRDGDPLDDHNHGTHVAGTIGAVGNDGTGVVGVNWDVQIMALKFLNARGSGSVSGAIEAINYAVANGAAISNNSWGDYNFSLALRDAIADANEAGHIVVAAAGNGNFQGIGVNNDHFPFYPASYEVDNVISVAAIDHTGAKAGFSNYGAQSVDVGAPGVSILSTLIGNSYGTYSGTSMAAPHVAGVTALVWGLHPDWTHHEVIAQVVGTTDPLAALDSITVTGGRVNAATAVGNPDTTGPEVLAYAGPHPIVNGQTIVDFGITPPGSIIDQVVGIRNIGTAPLTVAGPASIPAGFTLVSGLGATTLAPGEQTSFTLRLDAATKGVYGGTITLATNDSDESLLDFHITGEIDFIPIYIDNGDNNFTLVGPWDHWTNQGYRGDVHEAFPGDGSTTASWTFDNMAPGLYQVSATWTSNTNRASDAPFRIYDGQTLTSIARVNQQVAPNDFVDDLSSWEVLGELVAFTGDSLTVALANDANGRLNADGIRVKRIDDLPTSPDVVVIGENAVLEDGASSIDFGATPVGVDVAQTFTIRNQGLADLALIGPISVPTGFSVVDGFDQLTLASGEATTFTLVLDSATPGTFAGTVSFGTNDPDEDPFDFLVAGVAQLQPIVIDNGDPGFATIGEWTWWGGQGYQADVHESLPGSGEDVASWTFDELPPGKYQVSATWTREWNRATNAPFTLLDGTAPVDQELVNQTVAPAEFLENGVFWDHIGRSVTVTSGTLTVQLSDNADGRLNADAILIQRVGDLSDGPELVVSSEGQAVTAGGVFDFGLTSPGAAVARTFTLRNSGGAPLVLGGAIEVPAGYTLASPPAATTLASGESTSFTLSLDARTDGVYSGMVTIETNDTDQPQFSFSVAGVVEDQPLVIDDSDAGFSYVGEWTRWTNQGFEGDVHESLPGAGDDVASWTFAGLNPGQYAVAVTWTHDHNRASDAPFSVLDGGTLVAASELNQQVPPSEFEADGVYWNTLDVVTIVGDTLVVQLSDAADGRLNADAVRILRVGDLPAGPVAQVLSADGPIAPGATFDFGSTLSGVPIARTFTLRNAGTEPFELPSAPTVPAGYTLTSSYAPTVLSPGETVSFTLELGSATEALYAGPVTIATSDPVVGAIAFDVTGLIAPPPKIIDNGDLGFTSVGEWTHWGGQGYGWDVHESFPGTGADVATWTFDNLLPGRYSVAATWTTWINRATNSPYAVLDGTTPRGTVTVNQQVPPNGFFNQGAWWQTLGEFDATTGTLVVTLNDSANGRLNADAIRVELVEPLASASAAGIASQVLPSQPLAATRETRSTPFRTALRPPSRGHLSATDQTAGDWAVAAREVAFEQDEDVSPRTRHRTSVERSEQHDRTEPSPSSFDELWSNWGQTL